MTRLALLTLACAALCGCAALMPAVMLPQLAVGAGLLGAASVTCATDPQCEAQAQRCVDASGRKIEVTETADVAVPADEGKVVAFAPAYWQSPFEAQVAAKPARAAETNPGTLAVTDKSAVFAASPDRPGVRIPVAGILNVEVQLLAATGAPRQVTVESCFGRLDRFTFGQKADAGRLDSEATAAAAAELKARVAALRPAAAAGAAKM